jgi:DNA-binding IclR family transcriptional regulator
MVKLEPPTTRRKKEYSAPALEKGLDIIEALAGESNGLSSAGMAKALGRPMGQLFRMLVVLQERGYVEYLAEQETYVLTLKLFELSHRLAPVKRLNLSAAPLMKELSQAIDQSCHLVIYYSGKGHVVVQQDSSSERIFSVRLGAEALLQNTCSGHVLLAFSSDEDRKSMLMEISKIHKMPSEKEIEIIVNRIQADGYEIIPSPQIGGVTDIGYPIFDHTGAVIAALVVPFLAYLDESHPVGIHKAQKIIANTALKISARLGY